MQRCRQLAACFPAFVWLVAAALVSSAAHGQDDVQVLEEQAIKASVAQVAPSVVRIETFGGLEKVGRLLVGTGPTTGLVVSEEGHVLSSAFNFVQQPSSILVTLPDGKRQPAEIVARDNSRMLVLLKVKATDKLVTSEVVPREEMVVGQWSIAVGRTFEQTRPNVSVGILSAVDRIWGKAIQTDAKISPSNYGGPLIDIRGRVLGVLVPMSPQGKGEIAGAEWYDSGIGFAVPLCDVAPHLEKMKQGEDLHPGIMGISLKGGDMYATPAEVAACQAKSPAYEAGLRAGDTIVEVDGVKISRQAQLKHAVGRRYAGEKIHVVALRGKDRLEATLELTDKLEPYEHPFLGILPMRDSDADQAGVLVRFVYPDSPAAKAGIQPGDRLLAIADKQIADAAEGQATIAAHEPREKLQVKIQRDSQTQDLQVELAALPTEIPAELPAARSATEAAADEQPPTGVVEIKIPEEPNECIAYVPSGYRGDVAHGVLVWLHPAGGIDQEEQLIQTWKPLCDSQDLILLAPKSADAAKWLPTEVDFVQKTIDDVLSNYNVDRTRIVAHGYQAGGAMAYLVAFAQRDLVRGVAAIDAPLPRRVQSPSNDPINRLAFYTTQSKESKLAASIQAGVKRLQALKFPVTVKQLDGPARDLNAEELSELVRWVDTLDRI